MKTIIIIPSRMASTRFPGKPMVKIAGIPMVQRVWEQAIAAKIGEVYVACSENEVYELISERGGKAILTDPKLPSGTDRIFAAFQQIENSSNIKHIINLQGDMPIIKSNHIKKVIEPLQKDYSIGSLVTTIKEDEINNPNITKAEIEWVDNKFGQAKEFFRQKNNISKNVFHHVGIYSYSINSLSKFVNLPKSKNEISLQLEQYRALDAGLTIGVTYVPDIAPSIDTKEDLITVENIIRANNEKN